MLFSPIVVGNMNLSNRIVMAPMCQYFARNDGIATDWHVQHYTGRAVGKVGLIIVEANGITPGGRISDNDLGLWDEKQIAGLKTIVDNAHTHGAKIAIQLNHAGRKSMVEGVESVAPSRIRFNEECQIPRELEKQEIIEITDCFVNAARRAIRAGFDAIEIHGAHGYLINQFLSPISNRRQDEYGGDVAARARFLGEVVQAVKKIMPQGMPLCVRVSAHDYEPGGNTPETIAEMLNLVKAHGIDIVNVSSGAVTDLAPKVYPGYQIGFALTIKEKTGLPVIGGGLVTEASQAEKIILAGVDMVYLGRELLRDPYWPLHAAKILGVDIEWPTPYRRAK